LIGDTIISVRRYNLLCKHCICGCVYSLQ